MSKALLSVEHLNLSVSERNVLKDLSLVINPGEIHVLMGVNGAGKSSLLKVLVGHPNYTHYEGQILYEGQDLKAISPDKRSQMGIFLAFQFPYTVEGVGVANFLRTALRSHPRLPASQFSATQFYNYLYTLLDQVGLNREFTARGLNEGFSGGEKKRFELLQMLLFQPHLALLDELDSGLDMDALRTLVSCIQKLQKEVNSSFLIVTHSMDLIKYLNPSYIHFLKNGQLVSSDEPKNLLKRMQFLGLEGALES